MSVEKNITMRQFNGTDYDTLYPKTDVKQIENLTPSSIGAVSKSGDTMTGPLKFTDNIGTSRIKGGKFGIYLCSDDLGSEQWQLFINRVADGTIGDSLTEALMLCRANAQDKWITTYPVLHIGNAQPLGFPKIAIGSYVGTGTSDPFNGTKQNSLTFDFEPKMLAVVADGGNMFFAGFLIVRGQTYSDGIGSFEPSSIGLNLHITWSGNTVSWWSSNRTDVGTKYPQMNAENITYRYVALG